MFAMTILLLVAAVLAFSVQGMTALAADKFNLKFGATIGIRDTPLIVANPNPNGYVNPVAASIHGWMDSPGHRANILEPDFRLTAIGAWIREDGTVYFTEIFLKQ